MSEAARSLQGLKTPLNDHVSRQGGSTRGLGARE